ncbi:hypothetical protein PR048_019180 [Dryococelus australis]|uniref:G-protein coupled receptors family 3 profile domain-containing protein n=1 Tax=Dryococelus australis TaxID=614101 RepID=A0ABQ9H2T2_9NEOP|nr:hypothetical protein PR048_019180 [Dryococelus australis]
MFHARVCSDAGSARRGNCSVTSVRGRLQLAAVAWTVHAFNTLQQLPSVKLGQYPPRGPVTPSNCPLPIRPINFVRCLVIGVVLVDFWVKYCLQVRSNRRSVSRLVGDVLLAGAVVYDSCSSASSARKALVSAMVERECLHTYHLGVLAGRRALGWLQNLADSLGVAPGLLPEAPPSPRLVSRWLAALSGPRRVRVVASSPGLLAQFGHAAARSGVCLLDQHLLSSEQSITVCNCRICYAGSGWTETLQSLSAPGLVLVLGSSDEMDAALDQLSDLDSSAARWMFLPTDAVLEPGMIGRMPTNSLVAVLRTNFTGPEDAELKKLESQEFTSHMENWALPENSLFMAVASSILGNTERLKISLSQFCGQGNGICQAMPIFEKLKSTLSKDKGGEIREVLKRFKISNVDEKFGVFRVAPVNGTGEKQLEEIAVYDQGNKTDDENTPSVKWLSDDFKGALFRETEFVVSENCDMEGGVVNGSGCEECVNFARKQLDEQSRRHIAVYQVLSWKNEAWVAAVVSVAALGVAGSASIAVFITVRILKGDVLEGHPGVSFLLLATIVLMYCSVLPYGFSATGDGHVSEMLCGVRVSATCLSYALLFSIMISRGVMLASCDQEGGFMSHVNGYLQAVLCFFIAAVQVALSLQFWLLSPVVFRSDHCSLVRDGYFLPLMLSYDAFLLLVLVWVAPFIARSKRNYREGAFFAAATSATVVVWAGWVSAYLAAPRGWRDPAAAGGLAATATAVLVTVFIPRTYLMVTTIVRDQLASALPALVRANDGSVQNLHYRSVTSSQPLYDCVQPVDVGLANPNFYCEQTTAEAPPEPDSRKTRLSAENTYERYDTPPAPDNITRF